MDQYFDPGCGGILCSAVQIYLINGTLSEYFVSGKSKYAVFELKPIEACRISGFSLVIYKTLTSEHQQKRQKTVGTKLKALSSLLSLCSYALHLSPLFMSLTIVRIYAESKSVAPLCDLYVLMIFSTR